MPTIKGTASISSQHALQKQLRSTTFPPNFSQKCNIAKLHRGVLQHWIETRVEDILGFEDEIVSSTAVHLFLPGGEDGGEAAAREVDPRRAQLDLAGFLGEKEAAEFAAELWSLMLDGERSPSGIPKVLVEKKKEEMRLAREKQRGGSPAARRAPADPAMNDFVREAARRAEAARAAIAGARAGLARDGQAVAREGGAVAAVAVPPSPSPPRDSGRNQQQQQYQRGAGRRDYEYDNRRRNDQYPDHRRGGDGRYNRRDDYFSRDPRRYDNLDRRYDDRRQRDEYYNDRGRGGGEELDEFGRSRGGGGGGGGAKKKEEDVPYKGGSSKRDGDVDDDDRKPEAKRDSPKTKGND
eukprot:scaffold2737_cov208-Alexandrium_tamarense.AAC.4